MAHIIREQKAEPISQIAIYAIKSPFDNEVYINKCSERRLKSIYTEHYNLRQKKTAALFERAKKENLKPQMFKLQSLECPQRIAFRYCVAWAKTFMDSGYKIISNDVFKSFIEDPTEETFALQEQIKNCSLDDLTSEDKSLFPNYANTVKPSKNGTPKTVHFSIKPHEYTALKNAAEKNNLSLAAYCKQQALREKTIKVDLSFMSDYLNEFSEDKLLLRQILFAIYERGNYYPADLQNIQRLIEHLTNLQKEVQRDINTLLKKLRQ